MIDRVHDLRGEKHFALEIARDQSIRDSVQEAKAQNRRIRLDAEPSDEHTAAEQASSRLHLQQAPVIK